jgi:hypothetical protein
MPSLGPTLKKIPAARLILLGELLLLAREHMRKLEPQERRRVVVLVRQGRGRPRNLSARDRRELHRLIEKAEPRVFVGSAMKRMTGLGLPGHHGETTE